MDLIPSPYLYLEKDLVKFQNTTVNVSRHTKRLLHIIIK